MADKLARYSKSHFKLHPKQIGAGKEKSAIDGVMILIYKVQEI